MRQSIAGCSSYVKAGYWKVTLAGVASLHPGRSQGGLCASFFGQFWLSVVRLARIADGGNTESATVRSDALEPAPAGECLTRFIHSALSARLGLWQFANHQVAS
jgi:hypothetical protein